MATDDAWDDDDYGRDDDADEGSGPIFEWPLDRAKLSVLALLLLLLILGALFIPAFQP